MELALLVKGFLQVFSKKNHNGSISCFCLENYACETTLSSLQNNFTNGFYFNIRITGFSPYGWPPPCLLKCLASPLEATNPASFISFLIHIGSLVSMRISRMSSRASFCLNCQTKFCSICPASAKG